MSDSQTFTWLEQRSTVPNHRRQQQVRNLMSLKDKPSELLSKLWEWVKSKLIGAAKTIFLGGTTYLKTNDDGDVEKLHQKDVDEDQRVKTKIDSEKPVNAMERNIRMNTLENLHDMEVARRANRYRKIKADVLDNPELVDASSEWEAQMKLDLADGEDISSRIESNPKISESDIESALDLNWKAKWGDNVSGDIAAELNSAESASSGENGSSPGAESSGSTSESGGLHASADGAPTVKASNVGNSASNGNSTGSGTGSTGGNSSGGHASGGGSSVSAGNVGNSS